MTDWIGETFTSDVGWEHLETLVDMETRMAGSDGERCAAEATRDALAAVGARDTRLESFPIQGQNIHADIGPDTDDCVLLTSHVDAHDIAEGAADNGAGTAMVVEVARALAQREAELDTRVHGLVYGAEEVGLVGSQYDATNRDHDHIKAVVNNDGVVRNRTLKCHSHRFDDLVDAAQRVGSRMDHPIDTPPDVNPHSDHCPYVTWGVPGCHVRANTGDAGVAGAIPMQTHSINRLSHPQLPLVPVNCADQARPGL